MKAIKARGEEFSFIQDHFGEHPDDRASDDSKKTEKLEGVQSLTEVFGGLKAKVNSFIHSISLEFSTKTKHTACNQKVIQH